jgi:hypothetical protein
VANGSLLVEYGLIRRDQLTEAQRLQRREGGSIGECLIRLGVVDEEKLLDFYHRRLMVPRLDAAHFARIPRRVLEAVPVDMAGEFRVFPVDVDAEGTLTLAMADPSDSHVVDEVSFFTDRFCQRAVAAESVIRAAIERHYRVHFRAPHPSEPVSKAAVAEEPHSNEPILLTKVKRSEMTPLPAPLPQSDRMDLTPTGVRIDEDDDETTPLLPGVSVVELTRKKAATPETEAEPEPIPLEKRAAERDFDSKVPTLTGMPTVAIPDPPLARLRATTSRAEVAQALLDYLAQMAPRSALFVVRANVLAGFDGRGAIDIEGLKRVQIAVDAPSLFRDVVQSRLPYRGPLPETPANRAFAHLVSAPPGEVLLLPIAVRERVIALAYADGLSTPLPDAALHAVSREAGAAYERLILAAKR